MTMGGVTSALRIAGWRRWRSTTREPVHEVPGELAVDHGGAELVQRRLAVEGGDEDLQPVAPAVAPEQLVVAEVVEAGGVVRRGDDVVSVHAVTSSRVTSSPAHPVTWETGWTRTSTSGAAGLSSHRSVTNPRRRPPVSSQLGRPGSVAPMTTRTVPSARATALASVLRPRHRLWNYYDTNDIPPRDDYQGDPRDSWENQVTHRIINPLALRDTSGAGHQHPATQATARPDT